MQQGNRAFDISVDDIRPILNDISIFGGLSEEQVDVVVHLLDRVSVKKGEFIFERGDEPTNIWIVWNGRVELVLDIGGSYLARAVFSAGECFGETAVIGIERHTASTVALEDTDLLVFPRGALFSIWKTDKELFGMLVLNIAREACRRLNRSDEILLHYFAEKRDA